MWPNPQFPADLLTFTEEILNGKLHFLCSVRSAADESIPANDPRSTRDSGRGYKFNFWSTVTLLERKSAEVLLNVEQPI